MKESTLDQQSAFEKLPTELIQDILGSLSDIQSLIAITCSCPTFYKVSVEAQSQIIPQILSQELDVELLPEAILVLQSSRSESTWTQSAVFEFSEKTLNERKILPQRWNLADATSLIRLYRQIEQLAIDFASESSQRIGSKVSKSELRRFQRTFYRFKLCCNLFGRIPDILSYKERGSVLSCFSLWENEQLACVYDYLYRRLLPDFNDMVEHDIEWGEWRIDYVEYGQPNHDFEPILARGINSLCSIFQAKGYDEKRNLFYPDWPRDKEYNDDEGAKISTPYFHDPDTGPFDVWRWAHQWTSRAYFVKSEARLTLREWAYVRWDRSTLESVVNFQEDWEEPLGSSPTEDVARRLDQQEESRKRRRDIFRKGGRGWWSFEDESKVVWGVGERSPDRGAKDLENKEARSVNTVEEARVFLLGLSIRQS